MTVYSALSGRQGFKRYIPLADLIKYKNIIVSSVGLKVNGESIRA